ncbi:MAG: hydroxyacid dehydrogenase [Patescibacteria group bacterium]
MFSVLIADPIDKKAQQMLENAGFQVTAPGEPSTDEIMKLIPDYEVVVVRSRTKVSKEMIAAGMKLKVIARAGVGVDTIDTTAAEGRGIKVINAPGSNSRSVAEHAIGLMFAVARRITQADMSMKMGKWKKTIFKGMELQGKILGILGFGHVGEQVAVLGRALGMEVLVWTRTPRAGTPYTFLPTLEELLSRADIISIHLPKDTETTHRIAELEFGRMKQGVIIINTARGGIVDEEALIRALHSGQVGGAGLDVFENEPNPNQALIAHPKVVATPHIAALTREAQERVGMEVVRQVIEWAAQPA